MLRLKFTSFLFFIFIFRLNLFSQDLQIKTCINKINNRISSNINLNSDISFSTLLIQSGKILNKKEFTNKKNLKYNIASCSKHLTGIAIGILEDKGLISKEDYIIKYIPELNKKYKNIKIKHLLFHTSGLLDYLNNCTFDIDVIFDEGKKITKKTIIEYLNNNTKNFQEKDLGKKYSYTNSGYFLLSNIIERVSNMNLESFLEKEVFAKVNIKNIGINNLENNTSFKAFPFFEEVKERSKVLKIKGDQGVFMTLNEYANYANNLFFTENIINNNLKDRLFYSGKDDLGNIYFNKSPIGDIKQSGSGYSYGFRQVFLTKNSHDVVYHCGFLNGYSSCFIYDPNKNILSAVFGNFSFPSFETAYLYINCFYEGNTNREV